MSSNSIFRLKKDQNDIIDALLENEGLLTPELEEALAMNKTNFLDKAERVSYIVRKLDGDLELISGELERLKKLEKKIIKSKESLSSFLIYAVENFGEEKKSKAKHPPKFIDLPLGPIQVNYSEKLDQSNLQFTDANAVPVALRPFVKIEFKEKFNLQKASIITTALREVVPYDISFDNKSLSFILKISEKVKDNQPLTDEEKAIWQHHNEVVNCASLTLDSKLKL